MANCAKFFDYRPPITDIWLPQILHISIFHKSGLVWYTNSYNNDLEKHILMRKELSITKIFLLVATGGLLWGLFMGYLGDAVPPTIKPFLGGGFIGAWAVLILGIFGKKR